MLKFTTQEGHPVHVISDPQGVKITVITAKSQLNDGFNDIFNVGLQFTSILRCLTEMDTTKGYQTDDGFTSLQRSESALKFSFSRQQYSSVRFTTRLTQDDTQKLTDYLRDLVVGHRLESGNIIDRLSQNEGKVGRNDPCTCGSGKKYKKCCANRQIIPQIPAELDEFKLIDDPNVQEMLVDSTLCPEVIMNPDYWHTLGQLVGSMQANDLAIKAFDRAHALSPEAEYIIADRAVTWGQLGHEQECLDALLRLDNKDGMFHKLIANCLKSLGNYADAIPRYEKAIEAEPDFFLPYVNLLECLTKTGHPLFEYWINRAVRSCPKNPSIALAYCEFLFREKRLQELSEADWIDRLEIAIKDERLIGFHHLDPYRIAQAQMFRLIGTSINQESAAPLEKVVKILEAAPRDWHLCDHAKSTIEIAAAYGRRDLVWKGSRRICENCRETLENCVFLQEHLATASMVNGDFEGAVRDCEVGLALSDHSPSLLYIYWWSLDDLGRISEAIAVAQRQYAIEPNALNLAYNVGFLCGKSGKLGQAIDFYEKQLKTDPQHWATLENLSFIRLMEGNLADACRCFDRWKAQAKSDLESSSLFAKSETFATLSQFAIEHKESSNLAHEISLLNEKLIPRLGAETTIPANRSTSEELYQSILDKNNYELKNQLFLIEMEKRGDFSPLAARLSREYPGIEQIPSNAYASLLEAERLMDDVSRIDYSSAVLAFCKSLEIVLKQLVFDAFRKDVTANTDYAIILHKAKVLQHDQTNSYIRFIEKGAHLEMGAMTKCLDLCGGKTVQQMELLQLFRDYIVIKQVIPFLLEKVTIDQISLLATEYRNPAAHSKKFDKAAAHYVRERSIHLVHNIINGNSKP
jgi:tetratricopeptide (TPR) repeat protein